MNEHKHSLKMSLPSSLDTPTSVVL
jgi:hypothetical protein